MHGDHWEKGEFRRGCWEVDGSVQWIPEKTVGSVMRTQVGSGAGSGTS